MVQKMILSEGFDGDRHVMSYEEAKQEIYDIASTGCGAEFADYLEENSKCSLNDFVEYTVSRFETGVKNKWGFEFHEVTYLLLDDYRVEKLWDELEYFTFYENDSGELTLANDWFIFEEGTERKEILHWFDDIKKRLTKEKYHTEIYNACYDISICRSCYKGVCDKTCEIYEEKKTIDNFVKEIFDPKAYKFEDLKPNMFVFDKDFNGWGEILRIVETCVNKYGEKLVKCLATGDSSLQTRSYKENRFFPLTKAGGIACR